MGVNFIFAKGLHNANYMRLPQDLIFRFDLRSDVMVYELLS